jgi:hypothetical protein
MDQAVNRQPLVDIQPPQSRSIRSRSRPNHRQRVCPPPQPSDQTPPGGDRAGARLRETSPPSPTTQPRRTPLDRVGRCNPVHRSHRFRAR